LARGHKRDELGRPSCPFFLKDTLQKHSLIESFDVVLADPALRQKLGELGMEPIHTPAAQFGAVVRAELEKWAVTVKASRATLD